MTGSELGAVTHAEAERVAGELEDQPALGDRGHPGADERDQLAAEEEPVVAMAEGAGAVGERETRPGRIIGPAPRRGGGVAARRGCSWVDPPASRSAMRPARCAWRASIGLADHRLEPLDLVAQDRDLALDAGDGDLDEIARRSAGSSVCEKAARLRARAASSSSSWLISASEKPASSRRPLMKRRRSTSDGVVQPVGAVAAGGGAEQAQLLVVADRARRQPGLRGDLLDPEQARFGVGIDGRGGGLRVASPIDPIKPSR